MACKFEKEGNKKEVGKWLRHAIPMVGYSLFDKMLSHRKL
jgi:hypothetical protein